MASIENGEYCIKFYNKKGGRLKDYTDYSYGILASIDIGNVTIDDSSNNCISFTVDRRIYNSLDKRTKW